MQTETAVLKSMGVKRKSTVSQTLTRIRRDWQLYVMISIPTAFLIVFNYWPMAGIQIAFRMYNPVGGIWHSPWIGMQEMQFWLQSPYFWPTLENTLIIGIYSLVAGTLATIILALALNEVKHMWFKKYVQTITYIPYFISAVVMVGMMQILLAPSASPFAHIFHIFGGSNVPNLMSKPGSFSSLFVWSGIWQSTGYGAVIYLAALSNVNTEHYDAARIDGASRFQRMWHVDWQAIKPTVVILVILSIGNLLNAASFEKVFLMQNPLNLSTSEVISTYTYKVGLVDANFSFATAVGLFNSVIGFILLVIANFVARYVSETSLF